MDCDFLVVGAGIAGASAAYHLAMGRDGAKVVVLEREDRPGYHTTGRSASTFSDVYGAGPVRSLIQGSRPFFEKPPAGFTEHPLLLPRGILYVARADQRTKAEEMFAALRDATPDMRLLSGPEAVALLPALDPDYVVRAVHEPSARDIDTDALHQGYLRGLSARGGAVVADAEVRGLERRDDRWQVETAVGAFSAPVIVNAAGAWADEIAENAGLGRLGLTPKRRTVIVFDPPPGMEVGGWPMACDVGENFYFKPEAGRVLASPEDTTPSPPCDAQPEEIDVAVTVDRIERASILKVTHIVHKWAGLRSFFADDLPAIGADPRSEGFYWLAGQGGYGIMTSPAMGRLTASLILDGCVPTDLAALGLTADQVGPDRLIDAATGA